MIRKAYNTHARLSVRDDLTDTKQPPAPTRGRIPPALRRAATSLAHTDWQRVYPIASKLVALAFTSWAVAKAVLVVIGMGWLYALAFVGMNLPICLFSCLFVVWLLDDNEAVGALALLSTILNSLLI